MSNNDQQNVLIHAKDKTIPFSGQHFPRQVGGIFVSILQQAFQDLNS